MELLVVSTALVGLMGLIMYAGERRALGLRATYDQALASGSRAQASIAGRVYYTYIRQGSITLSDEQAMVNDLTAMGDEVSQYSQTEPELINA
ncbi:hypothetical protein [Spirosoma flavum]|uniref:Uncharacterized protein n=1 Tax=Spirosoma flavum TaxID=2048557 RepID=A0ABW6AT01_9BACT